MLNRLDCATDDPVTIKPDQFELYEAAILSRSLSLSLRSGACTKPQL